jgi:hypothetical protein
MVSLAPSRAPETEAFADRGSVQVEKRAGNRRPIDRRHIGDEDIAAMRRCIDLGDFRVPFDGKLRRNETSQTGLDQTAARVQKQSRSHSSFPSYL